MNPSFVRSSRPYDNAFDAGNYSSQAEGDVSEASLWNLRTMQLPDDSLQGQTIDVPKRPHVAVSPHQPRPSGACTKCKKVKMRCSFADNDNRCARCIVGGFECVVPGRKPRSPGVRDILRKQIREKDAMIGQLLNRMNPAPSLATPLTIVPSRLSLTPAQRLTHQYVLTWLEKNRNNAKITDGKVKVDFSALEYGADSDDSMEADSEEDTGEEVADLLRQLDFTPASSAPAGVLASAVLSCSHTESAVAGSSRSTDEESRDLTVEAGIGSRTYFQPGPSANLELRKLIVERQAAPEILLSGLITYDDAITLFDIFFKTINYYVSILDENIHTPSAVLSRCPFLFTVVCALASRFYDDKPDIYVLAMHLAKAAAGNSFLGGSKTVEMCQAYFLLGAYAPPARRSEEDRSWFYSGLAFRLAIELDLNRIPDSKPTDERVQRELLNRIRTWIVCYVADRSFGLNLGKPFMIPDDDVVRHAADRLLGWKYSLPSDSYLVSLAELLRIITRFSETINPVFDHKVNMRHHTDLGTLQKVTDLELAAWKTNTEARYSDNDSATNVLQRLHLGLMNSVFHYCRLMICSVGLQQVIKQHTLAHDETFFQCTVDSACAVLTIMLDDLLPTGLIRCSPEQVFTLSAFATAVLIKVLRPRFAFKMNRTLEDRIIALVKCLLDALDAEQQGLDEQHVARRYSRLLKNLLHPHIEDVEARRSAEQIPITQSAFNASVPQGPPINMYDVANTSPATYQTDSVFHGFDHYESHSIWDNTLPLSDHSTVPMPPLLGYPDPVFLAAMFSYSEHEGPIQF